MKYVENALMESNIMDVMIDLGCPAHIKGYYYLRYAILMAMDDALIVTSITKLCYPVIAKKFKTTDSKVERAIRNAVETSWKRGNVDTEKKIFGYTSEDGVRPTNSDYIARLAEHMKLTLNAG